MSLLTYAAIDIGKAIAKSIFKLWIGDSELGNDISSSLLDLLGSKTSDMLAQRKGNRQFEEIGDKISEALGILLESERIHLDEGECAVVALAVAETINTSKLSALVVAERNLQPTRLAQYMLMNNPEVTRNFSAAGAALYERLINESSTYVVDIASQLPSFTRDSFEVLLKREDQIIAKANQILDDLQRIRKQLDPMIEAERFEIEYRQSVARNLDVLQLIGADVSLVHRRYRLSVAYITLSVERKIPAQANGVDISPGIASEDFGKVDAALASSRRLLICGLAGSGKTTLLQWLAVQAATKSFVGQLSAWNDAVPFYIRLRDYAQAKLPGPEAFLNFAAPAVAGTMPERWVHTKLRSVRAIVLVDGVDEVSASRREEIHT
jgi:NACHT domain